MIGGLGAGGQRILCIKHYRPGESFTQDDVMWEFGPADDPDASTDNDGNVVSDMGLSFGQPVIAMSNAVDNGDNQKWVAIFGNGYNSTSEQW